MVVFCRNNVQCSDVKAKRYSFYRLRTCMHEVFMTSFLLTVLWASYQMVGNIYGQYLWDVSCETYIKVLIILNTRSNCAKMKKYDKYTWRKMKRDAFFAVLYIELIFIQGLSSNDQITWRIHDCTSGEIRYVVHLCER